MDQAVVCGADLNLAQASAAKPGPGDLASCPAEYRASRMLLRSWSLNLA